MDQEDTIVCKQMLQYFFNMLPSLSHEAKNALAIINENAGLMEDYILMAQKGKTLNLERLSGLSATIQKQVVRLNRLVKGVRQTADGIGIHTQDICLVDHTRQVVELLSKKAATRSIQFEVFAMQEPILIHTRSLLLLHILWVWLEYAMNASEPDRRIGLTLEKRNQEALVLMTGIEALKAASIAAILSDEQRSTVLSSLNAELLVDEKTMLLKIRKHHD